ncbi:hypothetical protein EN935_05135 [Mesorhizobium sp. M7D.F.Ca.US.004.03.1.1]|nr:hypothetical protein EN993_04415 [Mesorhizobium sp. M7D.F.Ca.US.004.01.2.1]RVA35056.1 hypothetical protein EN935_05135 [Mesorhizobium sp. M7D.F.Ca.US.004.03.1.1]
MNMIDHGSHFECADADQSEMTDDEFAAVQFEEWKHKEGEWTPPSNVDWCNPTLVSVRIAWLTMFKPKGELVALFEANPDLAMEMTDRIVQAKNDLDLIITILDGATGRLLVAGTEASLAETVS